LATEQPAETEQLSSGLLTSRGKLPFPYI